MNGSMEVKKNMKQKTLNKLSKKDRETVIKIEARIAELESHKTKIDSIIKELENLEEFIK